MEAFRALSYEPCPDDSLEPGYQKIALFSDDFGTPLHAARQLPNGAWTSKLGGLEDIEHESVWDVSGDRYGKPVLFMRRPHQRLSSTLRTKTHAIP